LARREEGEADALLGHQIQGFQVDGRFGEPHALGLSTEAMFEVLEAPQDLGALVGPRGQGHDHVVEGLGQGRAVSPAQLPALLVRLDDGPEDVRGLPLHPGEEGRAEVETDLGVVIDDIDDPALAVQDARSGVGGVALGVYPFVPVMIGIGRILHFHFFQPGIFPGRLVEVAVNADESFHGFSP
jgi:hypothetical protein